MSIRDTDGTPLLSPAEQRAAEALLAEAWNERAEVVAVEALWERSHVLRLRTRDGRAVVLKRPRSQGERGGDHGLQAFGVELASLEYLNDMPMAVGPRLLGADPGSGILLIEELATGRSLAYSLLFGDRGTAEADLAAYATALATVHAWSIGRTEQLDRARARYSPTADPRSPWLVAVEAGRRAFLATATRLGLAITGVDSEIDDLVLMLDRGRYLGFVHGDPCPDNVCVVDGRCRIFDFERSSRGSVALDAAYLLAPFPSCWCFANVPDEIAESTLGAYRAELAANGVTLGDDWRVEVAAALAGCVVAAAAPIARALGEDHEWGTTTMRPRVLTWTRSFSAVLGGERAFPKLGLLIGQLHDRLLAEWPETAVPDYPALAGPGSSPLQVPAWWRAAL